jgi:hypothetical protein
MLALPQFRLEDLVLDRFEIGLERVDDREVAIDDGVEQGVEDECRPVPQQVRLALGAGAHAEEALLRSVARREHEVRADEDVDLAHHQLVGRLQLDRVQHGEERVVVFLDLRPLVAVPRVLDGQVVQAEFLLHLRELFGRRVLQRDPDEAARALEVLADVVDRAVGELRAVLIGNAVDQHGRLLGSAGARAILGAGRNAPDSEVLTPS